ncbi:MAG: AI-2E family transporter [Candidatus Tectimicrobiota bacterium]
MSSSSLGGERMRGLRLLVQLAGFMAFILLIACLYWAQTILIPVALAFLLTFLLQPVVALLQRLGLRRTPAVLLVVLMAGLVVVGIGWVVTAQVTRLAHDLSHDPSYQAHIKHKLADIRGVRKSAFLDSVQNTINGIITELTPTEAATGPQTPPRVLVREGSSPFALIQTLLAPLLGPLGAAAFVLVLVIFMLLKYEDMRNRLIGLIGPGRLTATTKALDDASQRISRYLLMQFLINGSYGVAAGIGLFWLGVPYAVLWGFLAMVFRYIPYVGPLIGAAFPITISLVAFAGWSQLLWVGGFILLLELWSNMIMEPWLYGQSIGVSEVGLLIATGFWTWLWGTIGLVLATPLTVCMVVLGRHVSALQFFDVLLGSTPAIEPPMIFYQRLLAQDQEEATTVVEEYAKTHTPELIYDEVLVPALLLAWQDRKQGVLSREEEMFILQATEDITADLETLSLATPPADQADSPPVTPGEQPSTLILGCPAHNDAEKVILNMLQQLMQPAGVRVAVMSSRLSASMLTTHIGEEAPSLLFIAALPGSLPQARYLCRHLHKAFPTLPILVGYWGDQEEFDKVLGRLRQVGASYVTTSLLQSSSRIKAVLEEQHASTAPAACVAQVARVAQQVQL